MITANDARDLAYKACNSEMLDALEKFEREIREEAEAGHRSAMLCYCDCCDGDMRAALFELEAQGFRVSRRREMSGGVLQSRAYYAEW